VCSLVTCNFLYSSNCVVNLAHDKLSVIKGAYNALKVSECVSVHTSACMLVCVRSCVCMCACVCVYVCNSMWGGWNVNQEILL